jgi:SpoVK/Ycf46/Vps4 family AAA+-type ATPase
METINSENLHAVQLLSSLVKKLKGSKLKPSTVKNLSDDLKKIGEYLTVTENQALVFSVIFALQMNDTRDLDMADVSRYLDVNFIDLMVYKTDIDLLISRRFIRTEGVSLKSSVPFKNVTFSIDKDILSSIFMNTTIPEPKPEKELDVCAFVRKISDFIELRMNDEIGSYDLFHLSEELEIKNGKLSILQDIALLNLEVEDRVLFYEMCDDFLRYGKSTLNSTLNDMFDEIDDRYSKLKELKEQNNKLMKLELIKMSQGNFMSDVELELTENGIKLFMGKNAALFMKKTSNNLIQVDKISAKRLFFDEKLDKQVRFVQESLQNDKFRNMQDRLEQMSMPKGVAAIFYGEPGTGKTETVYQMAKETGRDILHVDISQSKSMWFGESEKKIKEIFTNYATLCKSCELKPILLFNEADALFGKRKDGNASSVAQTENAIQNIILEEMEKLEGILIATTNLNENLDAAFERRFLFKIKFEKPTLEAKQKIWKSKLDWLSETDVMQLATNYPFSGGEIDNIVRKATMEEVLLGNRPDISQLIAYCDNEKFSSNRFTRKLGF